MSQSLRILIVEDELQAGQSVQQFLEYRGHRVDLASNAEEAVERARESELNILVCDWKLAGDEDGIEVAERIQSRSDIPVILVTAHRLQQARQKARACEVRIAAFRRKPVILSDLAEVIEAIGRPG